jgi:diguanylate cyclase (GGDEF)-like protein
VSTSFDEPLGSAPATAARPGSSLGAALAGRVDEVSHRVLAMWRDRSPLAASAATSRVEEDIRWTTSLSTNALVDFLSHGEAQSREQARTIAATGKAPLRDTIALAELTKLYLYWREITIATLTDEARRDHVAGRELEYALAVVRGASDRSIIQMTKQFDAERTRLQDELAAEQARLVHLAYHDALTGLPNRRLFFDRLSHALQLRQRQSTALGLLFIDVDSFKTINDRLGHRVGDQVLVAAAQELVAAARASDTVARIGGDEFVVLCEHRDRADRQLVALARRILEQVSGPITTDRVPLRVTVSIGIATVTADEDADALVRQADGAMYVAKQRGPGNYHFWNA